MSVNDALDHASFEKWGMYFANPYVPLRDFTAYWWNPEHENETGPGRMEVYGNGRIKLKSFGDDFNDGNYNGWTVTQGSWTVSSGKLRSLQGLSLIRSNQQFTTNRHVRATVRTVSSAGPDSWHVAWLRAKYAGASNHIYGLIRKNGNVELAIFRNGQKHMWSNSTPFSTYNTNTMDINIVGNKAWVWVNGNLFLTITDDWFDDFSGYTAFYSDTAATAEFDDITIINQ
jgi:hypothetical protein